MTNLNGFKPTEVTKKLHTHSQNLVLPVNILHINNTFNDKKLI